MFQLSFISTPPNYYSFKTINNPSRNSQTFTAGAVFRLNEIETRFWRKSTENKAFKRNALLIVAILYLYIVGLSAMKIPKDTSKLKKHIALMCDRLNKGGKLDLGSQTGEPPVQQLQQKAVTQLEPLNEIQEEEDETDALSSTTDESRSSEISDTESVRSIGGGKKPARLPQLNDSKKPLPDLNKRMLVTPGSEEESLVLKGIGAASVTNGVPEDHERAL